MTHTPQLPSHGGEAAYTAAAPFAAAGDHSARAAPSAHLPLSKVNREVHALQADKKSRLTAAFKVGIWEETAKEKTPIQTAAGL